MPLQVAAPPSKACSPEKKNGVVQTSDGAPVSLRMKAEETAPLNGVSLDDQETVLVLEHAKSSFGTEFLLVQAGRKTGYIRAAYVIDA